MLSAMSEKPSAFLGLDAGGSSSRWLLLEPSGRVLARGRGGPLSGHLFTPQELEQALRQLRALLQDALAHGRPVGLVGGVTGFHLGTEAAEALAREAAAVLGLARERVVLGNDLHIAYASRFAPGEGVLVYAGTGAVGYHETASGESLRAGGYGYLIDDAGGGYWIGRAGLRQTLRWQDERGRPAPYPLARAVYQALGSDAWEDIFKIVYGGGRSRVAALAPAVAQAAASGDEAAARILQGAGAELARLALVLLARLAAPLPVALAGGIARLSPLVADALRARLPAEVGFEVARGEPVEAAARLALERFGASSP